MGENIAIREALAFLFSGRIHTYIHTYIRMCVTACMCRSPAPLWGSLQTTKRRWEGVRVESGGWVRVEGVCMLDAWVCV